MVGVWVAVAFLGGLIVFVALGRFAWTLRPQAAMRGLPSTPLEQLGWWGLALTGLVGVGMLILVVLYGAAGFHEDAIPRGVFWILLVVGIGAWLAVWRSLNRRRGGVVVDERDQAILARSLSVEAVVVLLSLVAWTVALTEAFWDEGAVPIAYLQLLFWSTLIGGAFGRSLGIVLGYRRETAVDG